MSHNLLARKSEILARLAGVGTPQLQEGALAVSTCCPKKPERRGARSG
jgi:hypothetical protein